MEKNFGVGPRRPLKFSTNQNRSYFFHPPPPRPSLRPLDILRHGQYTPLERGQNLPTRAADHALPFCASFYNAWSLTYATKTRGGVETWLHQFLNSALDSDESTVAVRRGLSPGTHWMWDRLGPKRGLGVMRKRNISVPAGNRTSFPRVFRTAAQPLQRPSHPTSSCFVPLDGTLGAI